MKTTDFINTYAKEGVDPGEYNDEAPMIKNDLHTIVRVATHLNQALGEHENLPTWVIEKLAQTKGMLVSVMDYMISQHEMGQKEEVPGFDVDQAEQVFESVLAETTGDKPFDSMMKNIAKGAPKQATADRKQQKADTKQQARAAFGSMFGGGNPANKLKIKEQDVAEAPTDDPKDLDEDHDQLSELSVGPKIRAYASRSDHAHDAGYSGDDEEEEIQSAKADKIRSNIQRKHGNTAAQHADRAATSKIAGRFHMQPVKEDATAGASGSSTIAVTVETLGEKGNFSKSDVHKKITGYSNMMSRGGPVKAKR